MGINTSVSLSVNPLIKSPHSEESPFGWLNGGSKTFLRWCLQSTLRLTHTKAMSEPLILDYKWGGREETTADFTLQGALWVFCSSVPFAQDTVRRRYTTCCDLSPTRAKHRWFLTGLATSSSCSLSLAAGEEALGQKGPVTKDTRTNL